MFVLIVTIVPNAIASIIDEVGISVAFTSASETSGGEGIIIGKTSRYTPVYGDSLSIDVSVIDALGRRKVVWSEHIVIKSPEKSGDTNGDSTIDIMDLVAIIDHIVYGSSMASELNADANEDGTIDIMDLVWIIDFIVGV